MRLTNTFILVVISICMISCSSAFSRSGYSLENKPVLQLSDCEFPIKFQAKFIEDEITELGMIKASDTGFSLDCNEAYVLDKFAQEACMLGADLINIIEETYPNFWSTGYRAEAEFLRFKDKNIAEKIISDSKYAPELIIERSKETARRNKMAIEAGEMGGLLGGFMVQ